MSGADPLARERSRARAARRILPWVVGSAVAAAGLVWTAGGGLRGAGAMLGVGLLLLAFVASLAVARCPTCGAPLPRATADPAAAGGEARGCPRCARQRGP